MKRDFSTILKLYAITFLAAILSGCWANVSRPQPTTMPDSFFSEHHSAGAPQIKMTDKWWQSFGDPQLNELIEKAIPNNLSIQQAWYKLIQAHQQAVSDSSETIPSLDATSGASRQVAKSGGANRLYANSFSMSLQTSYEIDLWGRVDSLATAAKLDAQASEFDLKAATLTVAAEITRKWFKLIEQYCQLEVVNAQIQTNSKQLDVVTRQFKSGQTNAADVLQQQQLLESSRGDRINAVNDIAATKNALAVLIGTDPVKFDLTPQSIHLPSPPAAPAMGVPADVLNGRPDVAAALIKVQAADYRLATAIANRLPRFALSAGVSTSSNKVHDIFDDWLANIAANLAAPIIDGGRLKSQLRRQRAAAAESFAAYQEKILDAVVEIRNAATNENSSKLYIENLQTQLDLSAQSLEKIKDQYLNGSVEYTSLLTSQLSHQKLQKQLITAQGELISYRIDLYKSLSGGWIPTKPDQTNDRVTGPLAGLMDAKENKTARANTNAATGDKNE